MINFFVQNPLVTIMVVLSLGGLLGQIKFGPLKFGAAGALFVGLLVGMVDPHLGQGLGLVKSLGVVLFCYAVGLAAGNTFLSDLKRQWSLMIVSIVGLALMALSGFGIGHLLGLTQAHISGLFAGVLTSPAIDAALKATNSSPDTLVGYAVSYPTGVIVSMIIIAMTAKRRWPGKRDNTSMAEAGITAVSAHVSHETQIADIPGFPDKIRMSYLRRGDKMHLLFRDDSLHDGDIVLVIGMPDDVEKAVDFLGYASHVGLTENRRDVDFRRFLLTNPDLAGRALGDINVREKLDGVVTRVRRGDVEMLATDDLVLQPGDRVLAVVPRHRMGDAKDFFGDSEQGLSRVNALTLGLGIAVGLLAGAITIPLPGGINFQLGAAAGPLVVGMVLGALHRTGPFHWDLPHATNSVLRQLGLMIFLACVGLATGPAFISQAISINGLKIVIISVITLVLGAIVMLAGARLLDLSAQRATGGFAGFVGQPALLSYANALVNDERIDSAYGALFALGTVVKILLVQIIVLL